jgi:hypothetical protein
MKASNNSRQPTYGPGLDSPDFGAVHIPWSEWGPQRTRWIAGVPSARWICWVHGHRLAEIEEWEAPRRGRGLLRRRLADAGGTDAGLTEVQLRAKRVVNRAIDAHKRRLALETSLGFGPGMEAGSRFVTTSPIADGFPPVMRVTDTGVVVAWPSTGEGGGMEEEKREDDYDDEDSWDAYIESNIASMMETITEEEQIELLGALQQLYEIAPPNPALYLRVWDFNPRTVRRALGEEGEIAGAGAKRSQALPIASDQMPTPDVAVVQGPVVVVKRGQVPLGGGSGSGSESESGTCLPYIITTVRLDIPIDRERKRGVVLDGEHVLVVEVSVLPFLFLFILVIDGQLNANARTPRLKTRASLQRWSRYSVCR